MFLTIFLAAFLAGWTICGIKNVATMLYYNTNLDEDDLLRIMIGGESLGLRILFYFTLFIAGPIVAGIIHADTIDGLEELCDTISKKKI